MDSGYGVGKRYFCELLDGGYYATWNGGGLLRRGVKMFQLLKNIAHEIGHGLRKIRDNVGTNSEEWSATKKAGLFARKLVAVLLRLDVSNSRSFIERVLERGWAE